MNASDHLYIQIRAMYAKIYAKDYKITVGKSQEGESCSK